MTIQPESEAVGRKRSAGEWREIVETCAASATARGGVGLQPGQHIVFRYDFGAEWQFGIVLDRIDPTDRRTRRPRQLNTHGEAPRQYQYSDDDWELVDDDDE